MTLHINSAVKSIFHTRHLDALENIKPKNKEQVRVRHESRKPKSKLEAHHTPNTKLRLKIQQ